MEGRPSSGCLRSALAASTILLAAISTANAQQDEPANPCLFDVCKRQHEANDLGINVQLLITRRSLKLNSPDWMFSEQQPYSDELNIGFNLKSLINSDNKFDTVTDQINDRLLATQTTQDAQAFSLGARISRLLTDVTAVLDGKGDLVGIKDEASFVKSWDEEALVINDILTKLGLESIAIQRDFGTAQEIQAGLCKLKSNVDKKWQRDDFKCAKLTQRIKGAIEEAAQTAGVKQSINKTYYANSTTMQLDVIPSSRNLVFKVNGMAVDSVDISDYQDRTVPDQIVKGDTSVAVRLGRDRDMAMVAAFRKDGDTVCARYLFLQLRAGDDIGIARLPNHEDAEFYGIRYSPGLGVVGVRRNDFDFVWDPSTSDDSSTWHLSSPLGDRRLGVQEGRCANVAR
jgi:hypothetical protein